MAGLPHQREALILVGASGFSYEEAAAVCDCAAGTIKSRVNRARARLFDAFYATQVEALVSLEETEKANQAAGAALLDKIGPAILITHSQAIFQLVDRGRTAKVSEG